MLRIYLTRHGQDEDNKNGILNGRRDQHLTGKGLEQAYEIANKIKEKGLSFDIIYSSPLQRAYKTAEIIYQTTKSTLLSKEDLLVERDFGTMTGKKVSEIESICAPNIIKAEVITYFLSPEGAETFPDLMNRADILLKKIKSLHRSGNILLVSHGDIGKMIYAKYYDLDWRTVLTQFHFGNCDLLLLAEDSAAQNSHIFKVEQHNH